MLQELNFSGKTALIMGASRGIGLAAATTLSDYGATVVLAARTVELVKSNAAAINQNGGNALSVKCDVSDFASVTKAVDFCMQATGRIDILLNNAGVIEPLSHLINSDPELWGQAVDINVKGVYHAMRAALPHMINSTNRATIVNISSGAANSALLGWSHYCSTKAAAKKLTEVAHKELEGHNICVVGLSPGTVATDMMRKIKRADINPVSKLKWSSHIPPEWVAESVAFLCGEAGTEFAGTDFSVKTIEGRKRVGLPYNDII